MIYDSLVIGGGPAGLSAAIYLARFNRNVLVIDKKEGRSTYPQVNENYLGFPKGIQAMKLRYIGRQQAINFGAMFTIDNVVKIKKQQKRHQASGQRTPDVLGFEISPL